MVRYTPAAALLFSPAVNAQEQPPCLLCLCVTLAEGWAGGLVLTTYARASHALIACRFFVPATAPCARPTKLGWFHTARTAPANYPVDPGFAFLDHVWAVYICIYIVGGSELGLSFGWSKSAANSRRVAPARTKPAGSTTGNNTYR